MVCHKDSTQFFVKAVTFNQEKEKSFRKKKK